MGLTAYQALEVKGSLQVVAREFEAIAEDLKTGDEDGARASLAKAQVAAADADDNTHGPGWWLTSRLPGVGDDIEAVRTVADVTDVLAAEVIPDVVVASERLGPANLRPRNGRIAIEPLRDVAPAVVAADERMQDQTERVAAIDTGELIAQLAGPVELLQGKLEEAASLSAKASYAVRLLPTMLGADDERTYLVLFQNNAEIRATGGMPGALAVVEAKNGRLSIRRQGTAQDLGLHPEPPVRLTGEEISLYGRKLGVYPADITFTPDFPRVAELARAMWLSAQGERIDGVLSVDPVGLSYVLDGTGTVDVPGGTRLTSANAVQVLLNDIYRVQPDQDMQNAYFAGAAKAVFGALVSGRGQPAAILEGLGRAATEGRLYAWSASEQEQRLLVATSVGGAVPRDAGASPYVGLFLNDGTAAKLQYYLEHRVDVEPLSCNPMGRQTLEVVLTLTSHAPEDAGRLPASVIGPRDGGEAYIGVEPGHMRLNAHLYAPIGGWIEDVAVDRVDVPLNEVEHLGHPVGTATVELAPGETRVLRYTVMTGLDQPGAVELRVTPGARGSGAGAVGPTACKVG
ncbi:MAG TPA: DUF4012 domain-containing protein [Nocardioidaceae bacterium]|nr:DUF4012 domain-containing protein [Nocardioidaceae bacterium]